MVERLRPHWRDRIEAPKNRSGRPWELGGLDDHLLVLEGPLYVLPPVNVVFEYAPK